MSTSIGPDYAVIVFEQKAGRLTAETDQDSAVSSWRPRRHCPCQPNPLSGGKGTVVGVHQMPPVD